MGVRVLPIERTMAIPELGGLAQIRYCTGANLQRREGLAARLPGVSIINLAIGTSRLRSRRHPVKVRLRSLVAADEHAVSPATSTTPASPPALTLAVDGYPIRGSYCGPVITPL
jgi:hypothetical protein